MRGVLTPGVSLAGVRIGDTVAKVKRRWGSNYKVCPDCKDATWFYFYSHGEPLGAAVRFNKTEHVVAVFTLGAPTGWRTAEGLLVGEQIDKVSRLYGTLGWQRCIGYGAMTMRNGDIVTSIYTTGQAVYGFALTTPRRADLPVAAAPTPLGPPSLRTTTCCECPLVLGRHGRRKELTEMSVIVRPEARTITSK